MAFTLGAFAELGILNLIFTVTQGIRDKVQEPPGRREVKWETLTNKTTILYAELLF